MPLASSAADTAYTANAASKVSSVTRVMFDDALWRAVNDPRRRLRLRGVEALQIYFPTVNIGTTFLTAAIVAEVAGVAAP